ncbi:uncharacterized protein LOC124644376 [Helicoverpa zea]|uniref:uncharacterized protein LOC124644376 n=1 Tax=Helicoverpa zea TaxID=7113 RepID=UPI001F5720D2|nr:uncharacterized protein LOC124644376 [Helicoverpa zea]
MPRTRQRQSLNGSHAEDLNDSVTMSRDNFTALLTTIQQSNADMCERMLQRLSATASTPTASPAPTPSAAERTGNFARCTSRFSGSAKENVETFIDAIEAYKECTNIYDDVAIKGMSMLLTDDAATWWQSIRSEVSSWNDVIKYLRDAYGDRRPEYKIYRELFRIEQAEDVRTDIFIAKSRALLSRLPAGDLSLKVQLDMVYGLLHRKIRKRLRREEFNNFSELLNKSRIIEETIAESTKSEALYSAPPKNTAAKQPAMYSNARAEPHGAPAARRNDGGGGPLQAPARPLPARPRSPRDETAPTPREPRAPRPPPERAPASTTRQEQTHTSSPASSRPASRPFCVSCRRFGHRKEQCRKSTGSAAQTNNNPVSCYQCGTQNVTRENCKQCNNEQSFFSIAPRCVSYSKSTQQSNHNISNKSYVANCIESTSHSNIFSNNNCVQQNSGSCDSPRINEQPSKQKLDSRYLRKQNSTCSTNNLKLNKEFADVHLTSNVVKCYHEYVTKNNSKDNTIIDNAHCELGCKRQLSTIVPKNILCCDDADDDYSSHYFNMCNDARDIEGCNQYACNLFSDSFCSCNCFKHKLDIKVCSDTIYCDESTRAGDGNHDKLGVVSRPIFNIKILGASGTALVDTGAKNCIAGHTLHILLRRKGHPLQPARRRIKLADGHARELDVLMTTLDVHLEGKVVQAPFLILPDARQNETLLGMDFLLAASLIMDFARKCWCFSETRHVEYPMQFEPSILPQLSCSSADVLREDEGTVLTQPERDLLEQTLVDNGDIFQLGGEPTPYAEHRIDTGEHPPISVPPYRLTPAKKELMRQEIEKMLKDDIIEECESAWCSPALLVPKANGSIRFCVDYRRLNAVTKTDHYPMPLIDELLQSTKRNCYMSTLDLRSGYWQVSVNEQDRDKTAFISPLGTFRFKRMPFGLKNAPSTFQRLIDRLRSCSSLANVTILAYLDDLLIISEGFQQHLEDLRSVFSRLREFKLRVNRDKCVFARGSVQYLGHVITQQGISPDPDKVKAVLDMHEPNNLKHLRTFLQTCSWFRKFIPNFSAVAEPLTRLTRKSQTWTWGTTQSSAFHDLKRLLTSAPVLVQADFNRPFILRTDASNYALGAVLLQGEDKEERPIEYASRLLTAAERNYSTTEREALAVVWAVERFRCYLDGHPVIIGSDHQPLRWLMMLKSPTGRLVRWALKLQSFDIQYQYTPGKANVVADTLSRPICSPDTRDSCGICTVIVDIPARSPEELRREQLADPEIQKILTDMESTDEVASRRWTERGYLLSLGVLYRYNPDSDSESPQLVIPLSLRPEILKECHDSPLAGHSGIDRTYLKIAQSFYFPGMRRIVTDYVKACVDCQRYKASNNRPPGLLQTPVLQQRNEVLAVDLFGPLPEGENGERWILLVEDTATRWVELFALQEATAEACARVLTEEYFLRYGLPRRVTSDNGVQFVGAVMQQCMFILGVKQNFVPLYHPEANPAERKNRDLKVQLAQLVENDHGSWPAKLPVIRFALNSAVCRTTGATPAFLMFAREMRSPTEARHDLRAILDKENFLPQITPYLRSFISNLAAVRERVEGQQDQSKRCADQSRRPSPDYKVGDKVLVRTHALSQGSKGLTAKFFPKRDGPYVITKRVSPTTFIISPIENPADSLGKYHTQDLTPFVDTGTGNAVPPNPVRPKRRRGRPKRSGNELVQERGRSPELEGEYVANRITPRISGRRQTRVPARFLE